MYENMDVVIKDLCDTFSQDKCVTTKSVCTWTRTGGCRRTGTFKDPDNKGVVIGVVVGGVAVVAGVVVVVVVKHKKAHGMVEVAMGDAAMLNTGFANNSTQQEDSECEDGWQGHSVGTGGRGGSWIFCHSVESTPSP